MLPFSLGGVRALIVSGSTSGPVATDGGLTDTFLEQRVTRSLRKAGFAVYENQDAARADGVYAMVITATVRSMHIENSVYYPWSISYALLDWCDNADGGDGAVEVWSNDLMGYGGSKVVMEQVIGAVDDMTKSLANAIQAHARSR